MCQAHNFSKWQGAHVLRSCVGPTCGACHNIKFEICSAPSFRGSEGEDEDEEDENEGRYSTGAADPRDRHLRRDLPTHSGAVVLQTDAAHPAA